MRFDFPRGVILKYYLYMLVRMVWFAGPVYILVFRSGGLSYTAIHIIEVSYVLTVFLAETPTGYIGDRIGRRNALLLGVVILAAANLAFGVARTLPGFTLVYITFGIGETFLSGTDSALLYDLLKEQNAEATFTRVRGRATGIGLLAAGCAALLGGYLGAIDLFYPFVASAIVSLLGVPILLSFPPSERSTEDGDDTSMSVRQAITIARETLYHPSLRSFVIYMVLIFGLFGVLNVWIQPISRTLGVSISQLGWLYAGLIGVSGVVTYFSVEIREYLGTRTVFLLIPVVVGGFAVSVLVVPVLALPTFFVMRGVGGALDPLEQQYLNDRTPSIGRATVLSSVSMVKGAFAAPIEIAGGVVADIYSPIVAMGLVGGALLIGSVGIWLWGDPVSVPHTDNTPLTD